MSGVSFAQRLVDWQRQHGRHDLPWQNTRDPYRVWLSEIMLQQTQVSTVRAYFARFTERFPTVSDLAAASEDEVLALWSGLGYYSRARNLHRAAQDVMQRHGGVFPSTAQQLVTLPGIGPSTAAAIASLCFEERVAILDGNVKRVLTRHQGYGEDLAVATHERALWALAAQLLPQRAQDMPVYTQAVMDLGATVCTPRQPRCAVCPVRVDCVAHAEAAPERYPVKTRRLKRSTQSWWWLVARAADGRIWLTQRGEQGIWAKLHCVPMFESWDLLRQGLSATHQAKLQALPAFKHVLTHRDLFLHPVILPLTRLPAWHGGVWVAPHEVEAYGIPAPLKQLLTTLDDAA